MKPSPPGDFADRLAAPDPFPRVFGVRHLSPGGAWHLRAFLDAEQPELVLVEGPSDADEWIRHIVHPGAVPPLALLAYTQAPPARSVLWPLAEFSPEYQALRWAREHGARAGFMDLPAAAVVAQRDAEDAARDAAGDGDAASAEPPRADWYERWARAAGSENYEAYWEDAFEHNRAPGAYREAALAFGWSLRRLEGDDRPDAAENRLREAHMRRVVEAAIADGTPPERIVVVCGAYHAPALRRDPGGRWPDDAPGDGVLPVMTDAEWAALPRRDCGLTLMPYSDLRLSSRTGYGAGCRSPRYFRRLWQALNAGDGPDGLDRLPIDFLTGLARTLREAGTFRSPAEAIEAATLARGLAHLRGHVRPTLDALRQAAVTCLGGGEASAVAGALAAAEVGVGVGELPAGVGRTAIQDDFHARLKALRLDRFRSPVAGELTLDLRENREAKSEEARWLDLNRSRFLHQLALLDIPFAVAGSGRQEAATWKEGWILRWSPEAEIALVESALRGETVAMAAAHALDAAVARALEPRSGAPDGQPTGVAALAGTINRAILAGLPDALARARDALAAHTIDTADLDELAEAARGLADAVRYGDLRRFPADALQPLLARLFHRATLVLPEGCRCNAEAARGRRASLHALNAVGLAHDPAVNDEAFVAALARTAEADDLNAGLSGYAAALLLERGKFPEERLRTQLSLRLSPGLAADLGADWFSGLAGRNHYALLSRRAVWEALDSYVAALDDAGFRRALLFLRRAFSSFSPAEKRSVCSVLADVWGHHADRIEDAVAREYDAEEKAALESLNEFDFDGL